MDLVDESDVRKERLNGPRKTKRSIGILSGVIKGKNGESWTKEKICDAIKNFAKEKGRIPTAEEFNINPKYPTVYIIKGLFTSWTEAIREAGYTPTTLMTKGDLIKELQRWPIEHDGRAPTSRDFENNPDYPNRCTIERVFDSWNNGLKAAGLEIKDTSPSKGRIGEIQQFSEFKTHGAVDLSGQDRHNTCDGICPKGEGFDTKSSSLTKNNGYLCWIFHVSEEQLEKADYLFLRAYADHDFTKQPLHKWRVPIKIARDMTSGNTWIYRKTIYVYRENRGRFNIENMKKYEM